MAPAKTAVDTPSASQRPLQVVRLADDPLAQAHGKARAVMLIRGPMTEVCAELDRLATAEAGATPEQHAAKPNI
ncbi:MAG: hypothetical protein LBV61_06910 [Burkholderiaceae bacterium]|nr:hypothetical protein [Burkholderiaceae bacterium]